jgi:hypothetical protein
MDRVAVVGRDLEPVEQITGRMNYGWTALRGGGTGALSGALIGWNNIGLLTWPHPVLAVLMRTPYGLTFGAILGGLIALAMGASQPGLRERNAGRPLQPRHFDIVADVEGAECVLQLLGESGSMGISHDNGAGIDLATTNSVITAWQGATSCSPRHNFTELPRTRSGGADHALRPFTPGSPVGMLNVVGAGRRAMGTGIGCGEGQGYWGE